MNRQQRRASQHKRTTLRQIHRADPTAALRLLHIARPYEPGEMVDEHLITQAAFERLRDGSGTEDDFDRVSMILNVGLVRALASHCSPQAQAAIWFALLTGARRGEIFQIRAEHIGADTITIPSSHTKTQRPRVVPIIPALRPWLAHFPLTITVDGAKTAWRRARVAAGMEHVNFHDLRHSCASILLGLGVDLYTIGKILGHSNTQTTQRYAHLQIEQQRAALAKLSQLVLPEPKKQKARATDKVARA